MCVPVIEGTGRLTDFLDRVILERLCQPLALRDSPNIPDCRVESEAYIFIIHIIVVW